MSQEMHHIFVVYHGLVKFVPPVGVKSYFPSVKLCNGIFHIFNKKIVRSHFL